MKVIIRAATADDVPAILEIVNHEILNSTSIYEYLPRTLETQLAWYHDKLRKGFPVIVAESDNRVAGFGAYGTFRERTAYKTTVEHSVYVEKGFQGKGIGSRLLEHLVSLAKNEGRHVMIGGIDADNASSIDFHEKHGFERCGLVRQAAYKFGKWLDLCFMQRILD